MGFPLLQSPMAIWVVMALLLVFAASAFDYNYRLPFNSKEERTKGGAAASVILIATAAVMIALGHVVLGS